MTCGTSISKLSYKVSPTCSIIFLSKKQQILQFATTFHTFQKSCEKKKSGFSHKKKKKNHFYFSHDFWKTWKVVANCNITLFLFIKSKNKFIQIVFLFARNFFLVTDWIRSLFDWNMLPLLLFWLLLIERLHKRMWI